jgi:hypothetical protein
MGLVAAEMTHVPVTTDMQITTNEPFKGVFCFWSAPSYKREFIQQLVSRTGVISGRHSQDSCHLCKSVTVEKKMLMVQEGMERVLGSYRL